MTSAQSGYVFATVIFVGSFGISKAEADTFSSWNGGSGNWSNAAQWTPAQVPNNSGTQMYSVAIGNGTVLLDISPTVNTLTLNAGLGSGVDLHGQYTTLTVNGNATVNGSIGSSRRGWADSLGVGGNLANSGFIATGNALSVGGNLTNSGALLPTLGGFSVVGTLSNTGSVQWGDDVDPGATTSLGGLINQGSIFIGNGTDIRVRTSVTDIPKMASWTIAGTVSGAFDNLKTVEGTVDLQNAISLGSAGSTINNSGSLTLETSIGQPFVATVAGNFSNSGNVLIGAEGRSRPDLGPSTLSVSGMFTNEANGKLNVNNPSLGIYPSPGSLNAQKLINYGTADFQAGTASSAKQLVNYGTLNIFGDEAGDLGKLTAGTVTTAGGLLTVWNNGGTLIVGSGTVPSGTSGYYQFADGILEAEGGELNVEGPASLDGTLDILLGNSYKPIGTVFTILYGGPIIGSFSDVEGLVFDNGRERYSLDYDRAITGAVTLTVEANSTPEPSSFLLAGVGILGLFGILKKPRS